MQSDDLYKIEGINTIYGSELKSLILLYQALIGSDAVMLFMTMIYQEKTGFKALKDLLVYTNVSIDVFESRLKKLENYDLIETYNRDKEYIFLLKKPLAYHDFINHEIYGRMLVSNVDSTYYEFLKDNQTTRLSSKEGYRNISEVLQFKELENWSSKLEVKYNDIKPLRREEVKTIDSFFDINGFMKNISELLFPMSLRTHENLSKIAKIADTYGVAPNDMRKHLHLVISNNPPSFDENKLIYLCQNGKVSESEGEGYDMPCGSFLTKLQKGMEPSKQDLRIIGRLANEFDLKPEVINVLLEYSLRETDNQLIPNYLYAIANNMRRNNIDSSLKALEFLKPKTKVAKAKAVVNNDVLPDYTNHNNPEMTEEEILAILKNYK